jgi:transposase
MVKHFAQGRQVRYFCQDESRFGLHTLLGRRITLPGVKPVMAVQWPRDNFWLYGAVEPATGEHFFYSFSHLDSTCFEQFIHLFGAAFPETMNLLHLDQAGAHVATNFTWPDNVIPIFQPSHSPELNPIERVWQDLKKLFKDKNFESLTALQQQVFQEINSLTTSTLYSLTGWTYLLAIEPSLKRVQTFP